MSRLDGDLPVPESGETPTVDPKIRKVADEMRERIEKPSFAIGDKIGEPKAVIRHNQDGYCKENLEKYPCINGRYYSKLGVVVGFVDDEFEHNLDKKKIGWPIIKWDDGFEDYHNPKCIDKIEPSS